MSHSLNSGCLIFKGSSSHTTPVRQERLRHHSPGLTSVGNDADKQKSQGCCSSRLIPAHCPPQRGKRTHPPTWLLEPAPIDGSASLTPVLWLNHLQLGMCLRMTTYTYGVCTCLDTHLPLHLHLYTHTHWHSAFFKGRNMIMNLA